MIGVEPPKSLPHDKIVASSSWLAPVDHALIAAETLRNTAAAKSLLHRDSTRSSVAILLCINAGPEKSNFPDHKINQTSTNRMKKQYIKNLLGVFLVMVVGLTTASSATRASKSGWPYRI